MTHNQMCPLCSKPVNNFNMVYSGADPGLQNSRMHGECAAQANYRYRRHLNNVRNEVSSLSWSEMTSNTSISEEFFERNINNVIWWPNNTISTKTVEEID